MQTFRPYKNETGNEKKVRAEASSNKSQKDRMPNQRQIFRV